MPGVMIGEAVGSYRVIAKVGEGPTGTVYLAEHSLMGRRAAIKVFSTEVASEPFLEGARKAATLNHPGLVEIFDFGNHDGNVFLVREYLDGQTLTERIGDTGPVGIQRALGFGRQIGAALAVVHNAGVVHGHLIPSNIVLVRDPVVMGGERAKLLDTGLARSLSDPASTGAAAQYLAPEQLSGDGNVDHRSDLYALGCIVFEMICGRPPFATDKEDDNGENFSEPSIATKHALSPPPPISRFDPTVSPEIESLVKELLAKRPDDRPSSADDVCKTIDALLHNWITPSTRHKTQGGSPVSVSFDATPAVSPRRGSTSASKEESDSRSLTWIVFAIAVLIGAAAVAAWFVGQ